MLHGEERLRRRDGVECVANFHRLIRILRRKSIFHVILQQFSSTLSFLRERVCEIYLLIWAQSWGEEERGKERRGDGKTGRGWQTSSNEMRQQKSFFLSQCFFFQITQIKTSFSPWCAGKFPHTKLKWEKHKSFSLFYFSIFSSKWIIFLLHPSSRFFFLAFIVVTSALSRLWRMRLRLGLIRHVRGLCSEGNFSLSNWAKRLNEGFYC